jgi:hypothetical protein
MYLVSFSETYMNSLNCSSVFIGIDISFFYYGLFFNFAAILYLFSVNFLPNSVIFLPISAGGTWLLPSVSLLGF